MRFTQTWRRSTTDVTVSYGKISLPSGSVGSRT
jgi:hypothetical protein